jgi:hypothetical protein
VPRLPPPSSGRVLLGIPSAHKWPIAAGLAVQIELKGHRLTVEPAWRHVFGDRSRPRGDETVEVQIWERSELETGITGVGSESPVGTVGSSVVFVRKLSP